MRTTLLSPSPELAGFFFDSLDNANTCRDAVSVVKQVSAFAWLVLLNLCQIFPQQIQPLYIAFVGTPDIAAAGFLQATLSWRRRRRLLVILVLLSVAVLSGYRHLYLLNRRRLLLGDGGRARRRRGGSVAAGIFGWVEAGDETEGAGAVALTMGEPHQSREWGSTGSC